MQTFKALGTLLGLFVVGIIGLSFIVAAAQGKLDETATDKPAVEKTLPPVTFSPRANEPQAYPDDHEQVRRLNETFTTTPTPPPAPIEPVPAPASETPAPVYVPDANVGDGSSAVGRFFCRRTVLC